MEKRPSKNSEENNKMIIIKMKYKRQDISLLFLSLHLSRAPRSSLSSLRRGGAGAVRGGVGKKERKGHSCWLPVGDD
jgi:hypothetical protein